MNKFTAKKGGQQLNWLFWFIIAIFVGRASLLGEIMPFTLIFWAMVLRSPLPWERAVTLGVLAGWLTLDAGVFPPWVLTATMLLWLLMDGGYTLLQRKNLPLSIGLPLAVVLVRLPLLYFLQFNVYMIFVMGLEAALACLLPTLLQPFMESVQLRKKAVPDRRLLWALP